MADLIADLSRVGVPCLYAIFILFNLFDIHVHFWKLFFLSLVVTCIVMIRDYVLRKMNEYEESKSDVVTGLQALFKHQRRLCAKAYSKSEAGNPMDSHKKIMNAPSPLDAAMKDDKCKDMFSDHLSKVKIVVNIHHHK